MPLQPVSRKTFTGLPSTKPEQVGITEDLYSHEDTREVPEFGKVAVFDMMQSVGMTQAPHVCVVSGCTLSSVSRSEIIA